MVERGFRGLDMVEEDLEEMATIDTKLLADVPFDKRRSVLRCMDARVFRYARGASLKERLERISGTLYLVKGSARVERLDAKGERSILCDCEADTPLASCDIPNIFGGDDTQITTLENCVVVHFDFSKEIEGCPCCMKYVGCVRKNVLRQLSASNDQLMRRLDILSHRSIRSKIAAFLVAQADRVGSDCFEVNMTRQELADYLCVERSALSREIGKMRSEGLFDCVKGRFKIREDLAIIV